MNTIDIKGDAQTFKEIIEGTISEFTDDAVTKILNYRFYGNSNLTSVELPNLTDIGMSTFENCKILSYVSAPNVKRIADCAFKGCGLVGITLPQVSSIGASAFAECESLVNVSAPILQSMGSYAFSRCTVLKSAHMPIVANVQNNCFKACSSLQEIVLKNADYISTSAFRSCRALMAVYLLSTSMTWLDNNKVFAETPMSSSTYTGSFGSIYVPASLVDSYKSSTNWSFYADRITAYEE